jgi:hypothetical protein
MNNQFEVCFKSKSDSQDRYISWQTYETVESEIKGLELIENLKTSMPEYVYILMRLEIGN